jgi:hypothetical protein
MAPVAFLHMLDPLLEQPDDVLVVERVEDHPAGAPGAHEAHVPQQPQLVRDGRLGKVQAGRQILDAELRARERIEHAHARQVA